MNNSKHIDNRKLYANNVFNSVSLILSYDNPSLGGKFVRSAVEDTTENLYKEKLNDSFPKVALKGPNSFKFEDTMHVSS